MRAHHLQYGQTIVTLTCEDQYLESAKNSIKKLRLQLTEYAAQNPGFLTSYSPVSVSRKAPPIIRHMAIAAEKTSTGPMSSVAGAIGYYTVLDMLEAGAQHVVFDNGGDIAMKLSTPVIVGVYTGNKNLEKFAFRINPTDNITACCTSSGIIGHSFSFGIAAAATIIGSDPVMADAAATSLGNNLKSAEPSEISGTLDCLNFPDTDCMIGVVGNHIGIRGNAPEFIEAGIDEGLITRGRELFL